MRRMLKVIHGTRFEPSDQQREMVRLLVFNEVPEARIAEIVECSPAELTYHFHRELNLSRDQLVAFFTRNVFELANQRVDLGVALKANELALRSHSKPWREPKDTPAPPPVEARVETLSELEVDREIARLIERRAAAEPADPQEAPAEPEGEPDGVVQGDGL